MEPVRSIFPALPLNPPFTPVLPELSNIKVGVERFMESKIRPDKAVILICPPDPPVDRTPVAPAPTPPEVLMLPRIETVPALIVSDPPVPPIAGTLAVANGDEPLVSTSPILSAVPYISTFPPEIPD
jgi:hypothetical protein